jgi:hypothetical protein
MNRPVSLAITAGILPAGRIPEAGAGDVASTGPPPAATTTTAATTTATTAASTTTAATTTAAATTTTARISGRRAGSQRETGDRYGVDAIHGDNEQAGHDARHNRFIFHFRSFLVSL